MAPNQQRRCFTEGVERKRLGDVPDVSMEERRHQRGVDDPVLIDLAGGAEARMEIERRFLDGHDAHLGRQHAVQRSPEDDRLNRGLEVHRCHLTLSVDSGVRAPGAVNRHRGSFDWRERVLEKRLDRNTGRLALPPHVIRTVVLERELEVAHQVAREPGFTTGTPVAQSGHDCGWYTGTWSCTRA